MEIPTLSKINTSEKPISIFANSNDKKLNSIKIDEITENDYEKNLIRILSINT